MATLDKRSIFDASTAEILKFAKDSAGLVLPKDADRTYLIQQIYEAMEWDAYKPEDDATHVIVNLPKTKENKGHPYQGGFNGRPFTIKRGQDVEISIGQYNTIIDSSAMSFTLESLNASDSNISEGGPAKKRIPLGGIDMSVKRFINKGSAPARAEAAKQE